MQVSSLSRLLNDAAVRAETRDAITNRDGLAAIAQSTAHELYGESYTRNKAIHDAEVPNSDDSQRLAQAKQATAFTNGQGSNPFKGMSRDQLALIAYDDSGAFTVNERRAALSEADDQEYQWRVKVVAKMMDDYNRTGKISPGGPAQGHAVIQRDIILDLCRFADHDTHPVINEEATTDGRTRVNFDASQHARQMCRKPGQPTQAMPPQPMSNTMKDQGVDAGITGQHFPERASSRIAVKNRPNILTQVPEHEA